jgi:hypothetical protein
MKFLNSNARGDKKRFKVEGKVWFGNKWFYSEIKMKL